MSSHDTFSSPSSFSYAFIFGTGRSGTQHLSRVLRSKPSPVSYITHEEEHLRSRSKMVVEHDYRPMAALLDSKSFNTSAHAYVLNNKIPFYNNLLRRHNATRLIYTGHIPMVFGLGPSLIAHLPKGSLRIVRLRRDRLATALSLMALGPEEQDPWGATTSRDAAGNLLQSLSINRRWFPKPSDAMVRLRVSTNVWNRLNRFQRWLWYVDDVECRWQSLRYQYGSRFSWMEESLENINVMDAGMGYERIASFIGVDVNWHKVAIRDNSIQSKGRTKLNASEHMLRQWDDAYRRVIGPCQLADTVSVHWDNVKSAAKT